MKLTHSNFNLYAAKHYDASGAVSIADFNSDLFRLRQMRKLINRYMEGGVLRERLLLNYFTIFYNCFGHGATNLLYYRFKGLESMIKPFTDYLQRTPSVVEYDDVIIHTDSIQGDPKITELLSKI